MTEEGEHTGKPNDASIRFRLPGAQKDEWDEHAKELTDGKRSAFVRSMVEAGRKKFDNDVSLDETAAELRRQRAELREEIERKDKRIRRLENQVSKGERATIRSFVERNGPVEWDEIVSEVTATAPERAGSHLDALEADGGVRTAEMPDGRTVYLKPLSEWDIVDEPEKSGKVDELAHVLIGNDEGGESRG